MIEDTLRNSRRDRQLARRRGVVPSKHLHRHFVSLARQVKQWGHNADHLPIGRGLAIGITSSAQGEGKSTVSFNLASALTTVGPGPVLLMEADFGNPFISRRLGLSKSAGLSEVLLGEPAWQSAVHATPLTDLSIMGCGKRSDADALALPFDAMPSLLEEQLEEFQYIVVDLPPATQLTACQSITPYLDGVILTVDSNKMNIAQINRVQQQIASQGGHTIGLVLNKA